MKKFLLLILIFLTTTKTFANHIVGGEVFYKYLGTGSTPGTSLYQVSLRLFRDCDVPCGEGTSTACLPMGVVIGIYSNVSPYSPYYAFGLPVTDSSSITLTTYPVCVANKPSVCYEIKTYSLNVTLPDNDDGYIIAYQNCCRAQAENQYGLVFTASGIPGATYTATIPGKKNLPSEHNNGAVFKIKDTALVCLEAKFSIDFSAEDADNDSLSYAFSPAYDGGFFFADGCIYTDQTGLNCTNVFAGVAPYNYITYNTDFGFTGTEPLGADVSINSSNGIISGTAPSIKGHYIVNVIAYEWRHGKVIATHQKDFIIHVEDCNIPRAKLDPVFETCNGFDLDFINNSTSPLINSYYWDFGVSKINDDTSSIAAPSYTYADTGTYVVTLITNKGEECSDTGTTLAKIYPGFAADFIANGGCVLSPYSFTDRTKSKYGIPNSWKWNFGDFSTQADTSLIQSPEYAYTQIQQAQVRLIAGDSKGCIDTAYKIIQVYDKPPINLSPKDTLICTKDSLLLDARDTAVLNAVYRWAPPINISNTNIPNPKVYPDATTTYYVNVNDHGCINSDSATVNVVPFLTLNIGNDTTICLTDSIHIFPETNAALFSWSPSIGVSDVTTKDPFITPVTNTQYKLVASAGSCTATDSIQISVAPYPQVISGPDTIICLGNTAALFATTNALNFIWSPAGSLIGSNTLKPTAGPQNTTSYIITVNNTQGCIKPVSDTTVVIVIPKVNAFAGNDTTVVVNQPLQLNATGGTIYMWTPSAGMNDPNIANPVVVLGSGYDSMLYHVTVKTAEGCSAGDDMKVIVFKTQPEIFIPSAFTPNDDALNDILRPKVVGMKQFNFFRIYNRWGQLLFNTGTPDKGWDGTISGTKQPAGTYVYIAQAVDYTGKVISKKGTIVLIR